MSLSIGKHTNTHTRILVHVFCLSIYLSMYLSVDIYIVLCLFISVDKIAVWSARLDDADGNAEAEAEAVNL